MLSLYHNLLPELLWSSTSNFMMCTCLVHLILEPVMVLYTVKTGYKETPETSVCVIYVVEPVNKGYLGNY